MHITKRLGPTPRSLAIRACGKRESNLKKFYNRLVEVKRGADASSEERRRLKDTAERQAKAVEILKKARVTEAWRLHDEVTELLAGGAHSREQGWPQRESIQPRVIARLKEINELIEPHYITIGPPRGKPQRIPPPDTAGSWCSNLPRRKRRS